MNLNELYTQIITENSRSKENRHPVEGATHSLEGVNPSCGDDITLQLRVKDGKIEDAGFIGSGCAISQASASLMIDLVKGRTVEDAHRLISLYFQMIKGKITPEELDDLEDVAALQGIAHVPARVKCAVLAWHSRLLPEALPEQAPDAAFAGKSAWVSHGTYDNVIPLTSAHAVRDRLASLPLQLSYHEYQGAHEIRPEELRASMQWLQDLTQSADDFGSDGDQ